MTYLKFAFMEQMGFRFNFFIGYLIDAGWLIFTIALIGVFYSHLNNIVGWNYWEMLTLLGTFWIFQSIIYGVCVIGNFRRLPKMIWLGELDEVLLKPLNAQVVLSIRHIWFPIFLNIIPSIWFIYTGVSHSQPGQNLLNLISFIITLICGTLIVYALWFMITCLAFFIEQAENLPYLPQTVIDNITQYPIDIFTGKAKFFFSWIFPLAFAASFPAKILLKRLPPIYAIYSLILAVVTLFLSHLFWQFCLKRYSSASS